MASPTQPQEPTRSLTVAGYYGFILIGWNMVLVPSLIRSIEGAFHQSDAAFGLLYFIQALAYGCGTFGAGLLTERVGRKGVLLAGALMGVGGLTGEALVPTWIAFMCVSIAVSWGAGVIDSGTNALFLDLYREARGGALNFLHVFFGIGALLAPFVIGLLVTAGLNWRVILGATALGFVLLLVLFGSSAMPSGRQEPASGQTAPAEVEGVERSLLPFFALAFCIGLYVAAEAGVSSWVVKFLSGVPVATATDVLSVFWVGLALGRFLSRWVAERFDYFTFTIGCMLIASAALAGAVLAPWLVVTGLLFGITGLFYAPVFPMIIALGGNIYPHRLAALSGGLTTAAVVGGIIYPPLMGVFADRVGLGAGMMGAALLGIPACVTLLVARWGSRRMVLGPPVELMEGEAG